MMERRRFLRSSAVALTGSVIPRKLPLVQSGAVHPRIREYRTLGRTGLRVSDIALGAGVAQEPAVIHHAVDLGVNYVDTAEGYFRGRSERVVGEVARRRREDIIIATKLSVRAQYTETELIRRFYGCLERLNCERVEILMYHNPVNKEILTLPAFHSAFQKLKSDGKVKFLGLSSHEPAMNDICQFAIEDGRFDVLLLVYNFMQRKAEETIRLAHRKNVGITIMKVHASEHPEQIRNVPPQERQKLQDEADQQTLLFRNRYGLSETEYFPAAVRWVLQNQSVGCAVMSMRNLEQVEQYVGASGESFLRKDRDVLESRAALLERNYCRHACGECEASCPYGVAINDVLRIDTYFTKYQQPDFALAAYRDVEGSRKPSFCEGCAGFCETHCRHGLPVRRRLISAHHRLLA
jgi:predicted aldo/keto reductase-like oxidoreductase